MPSVCAKPEYSAWISTASSAASPAEEVANMSLGSQAAAMNALQEKQKTDSPMLSCHFQSFHVVPPPSSRAGVRRWAAAWWNVFPLSSP